MRPRKNVYEGYMVVTCIQILQSLQITENRHWPLPVAIKMTKSANSANRKKPTTGPKHFSAKTRRIALRASGSRCHYDGRRITKKTAQIDHVKPRARKGRSVTSNAVASCKPCNLRKGTMTAFKFETQILGKKRPRCKKKTKEGKSCKNSVQKGNRTTCSSHFGK